MATLEYVLDDYLFTSASPSAQSTTLERRMKEFLVTDVQWAALRPGMDVRRLAKALRPRQGHRPGARATPQPRIVEA